MFLISFLGFLFVFLFWLAFSISFFNCIPPRTFFCGSTILPFTYHTFNQLWESTSHPVPVFISILIIHVLITCGLAFFIYMLVYIFICLIAINRRLFFGQNLDHDTCRTRNRLHEVQHNILQLVIHVPQFPFQAGAALGAVCSLTFLYICLVFYSV